MDQQVEGWKGGGSDNTWACPLIANPQETLGPDGDLVMPFNFRTLGKPTSKKKCNIKR